MADQVLFLGWNRVVAGREQQAMQLWQKSMEYYGGLQSGGLIESFEPVILSAICSRNSVKFGVGLEHVTI